MESKDNIYYCILLSPSQVKFLSDPLQGTSRCATLLSMIAMARNEEENGDAAVHVGQLSASITRLADQWLASQLPTPWLSELIIACFSERGVFSKASLCFGSTKTRDISPSGKATVRKPARAVCLPLTDENTHPFYRFQIKRYKYDKEKTCNNK